MATLTAMVPPPERQRLTVADLRAELDALERRYGVPSERRLEAFADTEPCESAELARWSALYEAWGARRRDGASG